MALPRRGVPVIFVRSLCPTNRERFDYLHQAASAGPSPTVMTTHSFNSLGSRSRVSEQSLDWESNGDAKDSEASLASAWGGSSSGVGGGRGNGYDSDRGSAGLATRLLSSSSAESEFYDAIDGESGADDSDPPLLPALAAEAEVGIPPRQVLGGGAGVSEVKEGDLSGGADGGGQSDDDSLEFEDARDPIAEVGITVLLRCCRASTGFYRCFFWGGGGVASDDCLMKSDRLVVW